jgi:imidazoleglycerol-phosphate dehydratase
MRTARLSRQTQETVVEVRVNLDGTGKAEVATGVGFLDHLLAQVAVHGLFDLTVRAEGDLHVVGDVHHTVEDVALTLGQAFNEALGARKGIVRMGACYVPMDESLAFVAVDLSGRPYTVTDMVWSGHIVGGNIPVTLIPHFFEALAFATRSNVHARVCYGRDDHHKVEALFKALGRALDAATQVDARRSEVVPSTKGVL